MEEILASIRRIISDGDDGGMAADAPVPQAGPAPHALVEDAVDDSEMEADADIFDLTDDMVAEDRAEEPEDPPAASEEMSADDIDRLMASEEEMDADDIDKLMASESVADFEVPEQPENIDIAFSEPEPKPLKPEPAVAAAPRAPKDEAPALLSPKSDAAVASAFGQLADTILSRDPRTLEDLVGDMLRPMLKDWLDDNLPALVEKLVREEIERVSRGRR